MKEIKEAKPSEAALINAIMHEAFWEYRNETPPSGAIEETTEAIQSGLEQGERAAVWWKDGEAAAMIRFRAEEEYIYFHRLSVRPSYRGHGAAAALVHWVEETAAEEHFKGVYCKVRASTPGNIRMYERMGYGTVREYTAEKEGKPPFGVVVMEKML
ncbi:GNAT family N-acetyltransferase [Marinococcus luteus]|uniref:GNAT family N-acetyltransferase n=1 Tax=Marinococcus luteus TaxID=1122204 RepID=UPI002ACC4186|nr:GNAT family N-acetyltransferase [Marinococcus luteus]MDZ5784420.1 GNAT family N-acetyltransferase [Marinococcus luteus]